MSLLTHFFRTPDLQAFMAMLEEEVARLGDGDIVVDKPGLALRYGSREVLLERPFVEFTHAAPWKRTVLLRQILANLVEDVLPRSFEKARPHLLPRLRELPALALKELEAGLQEPSSPRQVLSDDLAVELVYDTPTSAVPVDREALAAWGVPFAEALAAAVGNLEHLNALSFQPAGEGLLRSSVQDSHDAARLLLWRAYPPTGLRGRLVAAVPTAGVLLLTGTEEPRGMAALAGAVEQALGLPEALGPALLVLGPDGWEAFEPGSGPLHEVRLRHRTQRYAEQKALLDRLHAGRFDAPYVAAHNVYRDPAGAHSFLVWTEGMESLLPQADEVRFVAGTTMQTARELEGSAPWSRLLEVSGHRLVREEGLYPPRYRVDSFPDEAERARLLQGP